MISKNTPDLDYRRLARAGKTLAPAAAGYDLRVAVLSDAASQQFVPLLRALFRENGISAAIYEGAFDAIELEAINAASALYAFGPEIAVLANCTQALRHRYYNHAGADFAASAIESIVRNWDALERNSTARLIQFNFPLPYERQFGNYDLKVAHSFYATVLALNAGIAAAARDRGNILICDVEAIASEAGRKHWYDDRLWNMAKTFCRPERLPYVAQALVEISLSTMGRVVKCVILDLDNTLWGGVVGDDGPHGIAIGAHGDGEAFYHFQSYLLSLKRRGILLAVSSKNDQETAERPFFENAGMALRRDDITVFMANWENKADNIRAIRDTLRIGFDSMVFLDDNPFERNLVREFLPDVIEPEMPEDPADYVRAVSGLNLFEASSFSGEDVARAGFYRQEAARRECQGTFSDIDEYLKSLGMKIEVERFREANIPRIAQLIQRSNQFNLTTNRYNDAECRKMMLDGQCVPLSASLRDRFGDHGLISVVIARIRPEILEITDWLMSCRVLGRGVEDFLMNRLAQFAGEKGLLRITAEYAPTAKNNMVKEFFARFGFTKTGERDGRTQWHLDQTAYQPRTVHMSGAEGE